MKIRTRLTFQFIAISVVIFALALLFIFQQFRSYVENEFYAHLENKGKMTASMVLQDEQALKAIFRDSSVAKGTLPPLGNISIFDWELQCVFSLNKDAPPIRKSDLVKVRNYNQLRFANGQFRAIGLHAYAPSGRKFLVVVEEEPDFSKLYKLRNILFLAFFLVIAIVAAGGWFYAGQALLPVSYIVNEVERILPADLSRRLKENANRDELSHLTDTFNRLLDRIEQAFQLQRGFISNVSHELKNPIAIMDAQLQLVLNKPRSAEEYDRVLISLQEDVQELSDTVDKLLQLARIHSSGNPAILSEIRLDELIYQARANLLKSQPGYAVNIELRKLPEDEKELCVSGNEFLLRTAILNLLDNCCKFSPDHKARVVIDFDSAFQLSIEDNGPGIPSQDLPFIFEPFYRGKQGSRQKGSGIGLSLVRSILQLHHVEWKVESQEGKGTSFSLAFPAMNTVGVSQKIPQAPAENAPLSGNAFSVKIRQLVKSAFVIFTVSLLTGCVKQKPDQTPDNQPGLEIVQEWNGLLLEMVRYAGGYKAPVSARMYAHSGLAAWEASRPLYRYSISASDLCAGLKVPEWNGGAEFYAAASLNSAYNEIAVEFFPHLPGHLQTKRTALFKKWENLFKEKESLTKTIAASAAFGREVAKAIYDWSAGDSIGHQAFLSNYTTLPEVEPIQGRWNPVNIGKSGLLPGWGNARFFVVSPQEMQILAPATFSEKQQTLFFLQAMEIYTSTKPVSQERKAIAHYWSNDHPGLSFCPASRWVAIARQVVDTEKPGLRRALETYLKLGFALNDAAVKVWKEKYTFNMERPETYIRRNIDPSWQPFEESPNFPSYPSGHAAFGSAAAAVLEAIYGHRYSMTDFSNIGMDAYPTKPRKFSSFAAMAEENALSRVYMGVHFRMDCEEGLRLGRAIGKKVAAIEMTTTEKLALRQDQEN